MSKRLETIRLRAGLTLADFHRRLGGPEFCSYQTVQNYHFDRQASVQYLVRVAEVFEEDLTWLATGRRDERGATERVQELLELPAFREQVAAHGRFLDEDTRFLGPLGAAVPIGFMQNVLSAHARLAGHARPDGRPTAADYRMEDFTKRFDALLTETWIHLAKVLDEYLPDRAPPTADQQLRFVDQMRDLLIGLLPDRGIPAVSISGEGA